MREVNDTIFNGTSLTADARGEEVELKYLFGFSIQINSDATAGGSGTLKIEVTNDDETWVELSSPTTAISGPSSSAISIITDGYYNKMRIFYDHTSGTVDSISVILNGKGA
mgnify:CR=1 FL=1